MITGIMVDSREPTWIQQLQFGDIPKIVTYLEHGDLMAACNDGQMILVERKTVDDLLGSLRDDRLFQQLSELTVQTRWAYLVITGTLQRGANGVVFSDRGQTGWNWAAVQGALLTVQEMGVMVTYAGGDTDYEACILRLGNRDRSVDLLLAPPKMPRILSAREAIIAALPGIGVERMQAVLQYCATPAWALVALTDPSSQIPGIGGGIKTKIRAALGLKDDEQIVLCTDDDETGQPNNTEKLIITRG